MAGRVKLRVDMEDGASWEVQTDQRDFAQWEMQPFYDDDRKVVRTRFLAFAASSRSKQTDLSWPKFNAACVSADLASDEIEPVDPTEPDQSGEA